MRRWLVLLLALLLCGSAGAHEGEEHEDLREAEAHAAESPAAAAAPASTRTERQELTVGGRRYRLTFTQVPPEARVGAEVEVELRVETVLDPPDPLLGAGAPVAGVTVTATLDGQSLDVHPEAAPGTYGVHFAPTSPGTQRIVWQVAPTGLSATFTVQVAGGRHPAVWGAAGVLLLALLVTLVRGRALGPRRVGIAWAGALVIAAALLAWAFLLPDRAPEPEVPVATRPRPAVAQRGVQVPVELQQRLGMRIQRAELRSLPQTVEVQGTLEAPQGKAHDLSAPVVGRVVGGQLPQIGDPVREGQVLAVVEEILSSSDRVEMRGQRVELEARRLEFETQRLAQQQRTAELQTERRVAESVVAQRELEMSRAQRLFEIQAVAKKEVDAARFALEQARRELQGVTREIDLSRQLPPVPELPDPLGVQSYEVISPVSGTITGGEIAIGEAVDPAKTLFTVVDLSTLWARARVPERYLGLAREATRARVTPVAFPQDTRIADFHSMGAAMDPQTRTAPVIYRLPNPGVKLLVGMAVRVQLLGVTDRVLTVPEDAVLRVEGEDRVFVRVAPDRFEARTVEVEGVRDGQAILARGLEPGTAVVVEGAGQLASELARRGGE